MEPYIGRRFGRLTVMSPAEPSPTGHIRLRFACDCGQEVVNRIARVRSGAVVSCGCRLREQQVNIRASDHGRISRVYRPAIAAVFGRWTIVNEVADTHKNRTARCLCACGVERDVLVRSLTSGRSISCGCFRKEQAYKATAKHGLADKLRGRHATWCGMISRCHNSKNKSYPNYGGRGIKVCDRWLHGEGGKTGFECWLEDMGQRPSPQHTMDRYPDNDGNYEPGNVRWATPKEQANNRRPSSQEARPCL